MTVEHWPYANLPKGDHICVLLGLSRPIVLRQLPDGKYKVISIAYVHGLDQAEGLLGPIPEPWRAVHRWLADGSCNIQLFEDTTTGFLTDDDPRLRGLTKDWSKSRSWDPDDKQWPMFRNVRTGEETKYDPRLSPEELKKNGIEIQEFRLV